MAKRVTATGPVEGPWALPDGWLWERLPQAAAICDHLRRPINNTERLTRNEGKAAHELYPYYGATGQAGVIDGYLADGDYILLGEDGAPFLDPFKAKAYAVSGRFWVNNHAHVLMGKPHLDARLLLHWLNTIRYEPFVNGSTRLKLTQGAMMGMPVPVPPADVQSRLASRIDELFTEIDDGEAALARARADLSTWRKALLKAAVTGELTADWRAANPPKETGADLIAHILNARRQKYVANASINGKRYKEPRPFATEDAPDLPEGWAWASIDQIGEVVTGNTPPASDKAAYDGDTPFFTPGDLDAGFGLDVTKRTLGPSGLARSRPVPARSVLVTCIGATIGKVGFNARAGATNQQINTILPAVDDLAEYIFHYFDGPGRHHVIDGASSTTMPIINKGDFSRLPIPVPPLAEAQEISRVIAARYADADTAWEDMKYARLAATTLRQSILAAAFRGELA